MKIPEKKDVMSFSKKLVLTTIAEGKLRRVYRQLACVGLGVAMVACTPDDVELGTEGYVKGFEAQLARFPELNIRVLENEAVDLDGINLIGVSDEQPVASRIEAVDRLYRQDMFNIALVHQPSIWDKTRNRVELMLCGHTHNGQIFPFNLLVRLQFRYVYGLFCDGASRLYVSSGVGCWGCLLYTSPSPRDYAASRMPSSA